MRKLKLRYVRHQVTILSLLCLSLALAGLVGAQSGRKNQTKNQPPTPVDAPTPEPTPKKQEPAKTAFSLKVVSNTPQTNYMDFAFPENMERWVVERLGNSRLLSVQSCGAANLEEAEKLAKASTDTFIVLVELRDNPLAAPRPGTTRAKYGEYWIDFIILTPVTGKIKKRGRTRLSPEALRGVGGVLNSKRLCTANLSDEDYLLRQASFETAERIIDGFELPVPPWQCKARI